MKTGSNKPLVGTGIFTAVAASLCCISPVLALIAGSSGVASSFSWMEPFRPYLIGIAGVVLGFAWYQKLKSRKAEKIQCDCKDDEKKSFLQGKTFLGIITVFAALMIAFPYYSSIFYPGSEQKVVTNSSNLQTFHLDIEGMTCQACDSHVAYAAQQVDGVIEAKADHTTGKATVKYDKTKTSKEAIIHSINATGYKVVNESTE